MSKKINYPKGKDGVRRKPNYQKTYARKLRLLVLEKLGNECINCGFSDIRALQIDHINGNGNADRKNITKNFNREVLDSLLMGKNKYQLLCANCNWIKRVENKEHIKKLKK